ncbi:MAG TPA: hypothetical protein PK777_09130 [Thermoguttaceae bacterium]|nr:hypothetical protein [Thermoguttaceae bacterium]HPP53099.1 hypothetical protein [Thermoguttaceae bacterium]
MAESLLPDQRQPRERFRQELHWGQNHKVDSPLCQTTPLAADQKERPDYQEQRTHWNLAGLMEATGRRSEQ